MLARGAGEGRGVLMLDGGEERGGGWRGAGADPGSAGCSVRRAEVPAAFPCDHR